MIDLTFAISITLSVVVSAAVSYWYAGWRLGRVDRRRFGHEDRNTRRTRIVETPDEDPRTETEDR